MDTTGFLLEEAALNAERRIEDAMRPDHTDKPTRDIIIEEIKKVPWLREHLMFEDWIEEEAAGQSLAWLAHYRQWVPHVADFLINLVKGHMEHNAWNTALGQAAMLCLHGDVSGEPIPHEIPRPDKLDDVGRVRCQLAAAIRKMKNRDDQGAAQGRGEG